MSHLEPGLAQIPSTGPEGTTGARLAQGFGNGRQSLAAPQLCGQAVGEHLLPADGYWASHGY